MTPVVFRKWKNNGGIIALFPSIPANDNPSMCMSYEHIGQHGAASILLSQAATVPATDRDFADLYRV